MSRLSNELEREYYPPIDRPDKVLARLQGLTKGQTYTYHIGNAAYDVDKSFNLRSIIAESHRLAGLGRVRLECRRLRGTGPKNCQRRFRKGEEQGGGYEYTAVGLRRYVD
ncbi:hypothetical protein HY091_00040 [Candidatus Kaiserbacteria bacterium]|nr:hypothetical protein [Candidatus Kaiserbacteria bacterium]